MPRGDETYTQELADDILRRLADGETLRSICATEGYPCHRTVWWWVKENVNGFSIPYAQAREVGWFLIAEDILEIADNGSNDWIPRNDPKNPGYEANGEHIQRSRLRVDTRKWMLAKMLPKIYGDKLTDGDTDPTVTILGGLPD